MSNDEYNWEFESVADEVAKTLGLTCEVKVETDDRFVYITRSDGARDVTFCTRAKYDGTTRQCVVQELMRKWSVRRRGSSSGHDYKIKPIETRYNGVMYRSRLEARWAKFFHEVGMDVEYEPECFRIGGRRYLPDFRLGNTYLEIKPTPEFVNRSLYAGFCVAVGRIFVVCGQPRQLSFTTYIFSNLSSIWLGGMQYLKRDDSERYVPVVCNSDGFQQRAEGVREIRRDEVPDTVAVTSRATVGKCDRSMIRGCVECGLPYVKVQEPDYFEPFLSKCSCKAGFREDPAVEAGMNVAVAERFGT